jgi:molybdopterin/thiamine biosynthesis adenylyltransferase
MNPKLNSTVSVVKITDFILEFFKTNTRQQIRIKVEDDTILNLVMGLDGTRTIEELIEEYNLERETMIQLMDFLREKGILDNVMPISDFDGYDEYRRIIHFLADFSSNHSQLVQMWNNVRDSTVLIIGLGAVGSWVACNLVQSGVKNIVLMDGDVVEASNLHRQFGYKESDIGKRKVDVLEERLKEYEPYVNVKKVSEFLDETTLYIFDEYAVDLIINCADKPNVDTTSLWVGEYGMQRNIPHIVGGGYNLHLSLIGQTIIPGKCACVKCFQKQLEEDNRIDPNRVKKLSIKNRKIGSFGPMCSLIASMVGMEAIKVLSKQIEPANMNRRGEFDIYTMNISYKTFERRKDCEWCGEQGKYCYS